MSPFAWERYSPRTATGGTSTAVLPALRSGAGREPGSVPALWPHHTRFDPDGRLTRDLRAEHICLVLFGIHQQGTSTRVHQPGQPFAHAVRRLRDTRRFSDDALDERFLRAIGADQITETDHHLRGLVTQLRTVAGLGFDYTALFHDLRHLQHEASAPRIRRRWGAAYFTHTPDTSPDTSPDQAGANPAAKEIRA